MKPDLGAPIRIASWETGTEGWAPGDWQTNAGTVTQTADFHTEGSVGLRVAAVEGGWFGITFAEPVDLSNKSAVRYDPADRPDDRHVAQRGPAGRLEYTWCQSTFVWIGQGTTTTVEVDLLSEMSCDPATFTDVRRIFLWVSPGQHDLDNLRAE